MTIDELVKKLQDAQAAGHGRARVVFDTDAACFNVHLVNVDIACLEDGSVMSSGEALFIMTTGTYHGTCDCRRVMVAQEVAKAKEGKES